MLVVTRKVNQRLLIGQDIVVSVGRVLADGRVRLCIEAPPSVKIAREELLVQEKPRA